MAGCVTCKAKRLKCGEEKPGCQNCAKRKVPCGGYKKTFQWRDYGKPDVKTNVERQNKPASPTRHMSASSSKVTTPSSEFPPIPLSLDHQRSQSRDQIATNPNQADDDENGFSQQHATPSPSLPKDSTKRDSALTMPPEQLPDPAPPPENVDQSPQEFASVSFDPQAVFTFRSRSLSPGRSGSTPTLTEFLLADHPLDSGFSQDFVPFSMPEDMQLPLWSAGGNDSLLGNGALVDEDMDFIEPNQSMNSQVSAWPSRISSPSSSQASGSPGMVLMGANNMALNLYTQPDFPIGSMEHLSMLFDRETCGILSIMDGPTENPWRSVVWPMAQSSPALLYAVLAMTAYHNSQQYRSLKRVGHEHKQTSMRNIQEGIRENSMSDQTALATALALSFAESWDRHIESGNAHIKGAQALVKRALEDHRMNPCTGIELKSLKFLSNAWVYMDVIARLTCVDNDDSTDFDIGAFSAPDAPELFTGNRGARKDGFGINFGMPIDTSLDPVMGCAGTLFPYIGRVANLIRKVCRSLNNSPGIVSLARDLKTSLDDWDPPEEIDRPEDLSTKTQHAVQTAEAYRLATLLHLHSAVPELPSSSSTDLARKVLATLATIPMSSRTVVVQMYPLLAAGCEAHEPDDRQWVRERWHAMGERMRIGVVDKCLAVTEEVWRRRDIYESKPINNRKLVKTEELLAAIRNGSSRSPTDSPSDSGVLGVIYSWVETDSEPKGMTPLKDINGPEAARFKKDVADRVKVDPAYSVRGHLHWVGVCHEWNFELLLA